MAHQVQVNEDGIELPDGNKYDSGATVTLSNSEYERINPSAFDSVLTDLGEVGTDTGSLADLDDVLISNPQIGDTVMWGGNAWINTPPAPDVDVGGGSVGINDGPILHVDYNTAAPLDTQDPDAIGNNSGSILTIVDAQLTSSDAQTSLASGVPGPDPVAVGDFVVANDTDLLFRKAGLYAIAYSLQYPGLSAPAKNALSPYFPNAEATYWPNDEVADAPRSPQGTLLLPVYPSSVNTVALQWYTWQSSGTARSPALQINITRVL